MTTVTAGHGRGGSGSSSSSVASTAAAAADASGSIPGASTQRPLLVVGTRAGTSTGTGSTVPATAAQVAVAGAGAADPSAQPQRRGVLHAEAMHAGGGMIGIVDGASHGDLEALGATGSLSGGHDKGAGAVPLAASIPQAAAQTVPQVHGSVDGRPVTVTSSELESIMMIERISAVERYTMHRGKAIPI